MNPEHYSAGFHIRNTRRVQVHYEKRSESEKTILHGFGGHDCVNGSIYGPSGMCLWYNIHLHGSPKPQTVDSVGMFRLLYHGDRL